MSHFENLSEPTTMNYLMKMKELKKLIHGKLEN